MFSTHNLQMWKPYIEWSKVREDDDGIATLYTKQPFDLRNL